MAERDAISHGATSRDAKLAVPSTTLPLLMMGDWSAGPEFPGATPMGPPCGLMRDFEWSSRRPISFGGDTFLLLRGKLDSSEDFLSDEA
jgi:hypothetical protein